MDGVMMEIRKQIGIDGMNFVSHTLKPYPWGNELPVTIMLDDGSVYEEIIRFAKPPTEKEIAIAVQDRVAKLSLPEPEPDEMLSKAEVEAILRDKGYLAQEENWEGLKAKEDSGHAGKGI
jgi:hypothetical protein